MYLNVFRRAAAASTSKSKDDQEWWPEAEKFLQNKATFRFSIFVYLVCFSIGYTGVELLI